MAVAAEIQRHGPLGRYCGHRGSLGNGSEQETVAGTLATIADQIEVAELRPPATVIIGEEVALREKLTGSSSFRCLEKRSSSRERRTGRGIVGSPARPREPSRKNCR